MENNFQKQAKELYNKAIDVVNREVDSKSNFDGEAFDILQNNYFLYLS